jgi:hypothetical protein
MKKETISPAVCFSKFELFFICRLPCFTMEYKDYNQTNLNIYAELLGGQNLDWEYEKYYLDLAPSVQLIFKSTSKLNLGYRFQLKSDIYRNMKSSWMISYEYIFLNALKKKPAK